MAVAESGPQASLLFHEGDFAIVAAAARLPGYSGFELCRLLRQMRSGGEVTFLLLCDFDDAAELAWAIGCRADGLLRRGSEPGHLARRIDAHRLRSPWLPLGVVPPSDHPDRSWTPGLSGDAARLRGVLLSLFEEVMHLAPAGGEWQERASRPAPAAAPPTAGVERVSSAAADELRRRAIVQLATGLSHQIANPVAALVLNHAALREQLAELRAAMKQGARVDDSARPAPKLAAALTEIEEIVDESGQSLERVQATLSELSVFTGRPRPGHARVDLNAVVRAVCHLKEAGLTVRGRLELDLRPLPPILGDEAGLADALSLLLDWVAARWSTEEAGGPRLRISTRRIAEDAALLVDDSALTLSPEERGALFDPYSSLWQRHPQSSGLAMSILQEYVARHGGALRVAGDPKASPRLEVLLPVEATANAPPAPLSVGRRPRILVVDDEPNLLRAFRRMLGGYDVLLAEGGPAAEAILARDKDFDALLVDLVMPDLDGKQLYDLIAQEAPQLLPRIVFCTGGIFSSALDSFVRSVANPLVLKPVAAEALRATLAKIVGSS